MGRKISKPRESTYTICLVCEGEKTEPYFYTNLAEDLKPTYKLHTDPLIGESKSAGVIGRPIRHRDLLQLGDEVQEAIHEAFPLNFVEVGKKYLESGMHNEVWVIYDKDGHPQHAEAWQAVLDYRNNINKKLNLVFSSRCFEYYILEHFEFIKRPFEECECKARNEEKGEPEAQNCCRTDKRNLPLSQACDGVNGSICINGYARHHHYWENDEVKKGNSYNKISNLWTGIMHAHRLKWWSLVNIDPRTPIYMRNPYLNAYRLTLRLNEMSSLEQGDEIVETYKTGALVIKRRGDTLMVRNEDNRTFIFGSLQVKKHQNPIGVKDKWGKGDEIPLALKHCLAPGSEITIDLTQIIGIDEFLIIQFGGHDYFCALEGNPPEGIKLNEVELTTPLFTPIVE